MRSKILMTALLAAATAFGGAAQAVPVNYNFSATAAGGPLTGNVFNGSFTVDSAVVATGSGAISNLSLSVLGTTLTGSQDAFGLSPIAQFGATGGLQFINNFVVLSTARAAAIGDPADGYPLPSPITSLSMFGSFAYGIDAAQGETFTGGAIIGAPAVVVAAPEPISLSVLSMGLAGLAVARRRRGAPIC